MESSKPLLDKKPSITNNETVGKMISRETSVDKASEASSTRSRQHSVHYQPSVDGSVDVQTLDDELPGSANGTTHGNYDTKNLKSFKHYTREVLPRIDYYRNLMSIIKGNFNQGQANVRPTLDELRGVQTNIPLETPPIMDESLIQQQMNSSEFDKPAVKFGWVKGVLVRNLLSIWGVILFLRISWVAAQAGIIHGTLIIFLSSLCTWLTSMSMSAICTNGEVKGGGTYYMISRSLGPEFGGAIGVIFALASAIAAAMNMVGFAETWVDMFRIHFQYKIYDGALNDVRLISCSMLIILIIIVFIGTGCEAKAQVFLLYVLIAAMLNFVLGTLVGPKSNLEIARGFVGWNTTLLWTNMQPAYRNGHGFFSVFSIYFPAATGILAGANISGDLRNPSKAIPLGTFLAILITTLVYMLFHFIEAANVVRDANGLVDLVQYKINSSVILPTVWNNIQQCSLSPDQKCGYGLMNHYQIVEMMSWYGPLIYVGISAATMSSALGCLISAPKVFQALCNDRLLPYISFFGRGYGPNNEPRYGYLLGFVIAFSCCLLGQLNLIAPIISNFFLAAYTLINFSCFHASFTKSPGFRPSFRYYNKWLSLVSAVMMLLVMFITDWFAALLTFIIIMVLYMWIMYRNPDVNWGSSTQAQTFNSALNSVYKLNLVPSHVKTYRPQILLLYKNKCDLSNLNPYYVNVDYVDLAYSITKSSGLLICGHIITNQTPSHLQMAFSNDGNNWLVKNNFKAFIDVIQDSSFLQGARVLIQISGIGKLRPNIVMLPYMVNWNQCPDEALSEYFNTIHAIFDYQLSIVIVHLPKALSFNDDDQEKEAFLKSLEPPLNNLVESNDSTEMKPMVITSNSGQNSPMPPTLGSKLLSRKPLQNQAKGFIDVWWLYDDGGLTLLLPYILRSNPQWNNCKLRIFALANKKQELDIDQRNMATLLSKFRIDYSSVKMITDIRKLPKTESRKLFEKMIAQYVVNDENDEVDEQEENEASAAETESPKKTENRQFKITKSDLDQFKEKTNRYIRLHELLLEHSIDSKLVVVTLPMPRKDRCMAPLYMAWLDMLTRDMPPMMLMRGNQTNVLTFYS